MAGMVEEVIPGVPRNVEPPTPRLPSVHVRLDLCVHRLTQASLLLSAFCQLKVKAPMYTVKNGIGASIY